MKEKLDKGIAMLVASQPENAYLREQQSLLPQAKISTIHSFCLDLLKQNYYQACLDANFKVASETQIVLLEQEIIVDLLEEAYDDPSSGIGALADAYGGNKDDSGLIDIILCLYKFCRSRPQPLNWLADACAVFSYSDLERYPFSPDSIIRLKRILNQAAYHLEKAWQMSSRICDKWQAKIADELEQIKIIEKEHSSSLTELIDAIGQLSFCRLNPVADADLALKEQLKKERDKAKQLIKKTKDRYAPITAACQVKELRAVAPLMQSLYQLIADFDQKFSEGKTAAGMDRFWRYGASDLGFIG